MSRTCFNACCLFCTIVCCLSADPARGQHVEVVFPERPPFNSMENGKPTGILADLTMRIFQDAGIDAHFAVLPATRILIELQKEGTPMCSFGWFKNPEREAYARYTLPIFKDTPLLAVYLKKNAAFFQDNPTLRGLLRDRRLTLGLIKGFSYGTGVDEAVKDAQVDVVDCYGRLQQALMLANDRFTYTLIRQWEAQDLFRLSGRNPDEFQTTSLADIHEATERYILCGKGVPQDVIDRLNAAIRRIVPDTTQ